MADITQPISESTTGLDAAAAPTGQRFRRDRLAIWIIITILAVVTLFPLYWALRTALSTQRDLLADPANPLPVGYTLDNFKAALGMISKSDSIAAGGSGRTFDFWNYLKNTIIVSALVAVFQVIFSAMAAYALARLRFPGRDLIFMMFVAALMVPGIVLLIPNFVLIYDLGWMNTYRGIVAPTILMSPFAIFFLRQFFLGINRELEEAAHLDGAGYFEVFWRIILPIANGPMVTLGIIVFITQWNDYLWPFLVGREEGVRVLTVALSVFRSQTPQGSPDWPGLMAGTLLATVPIIFIFLLLGRRIANSLQFTGVK
jgi:multiple sugar transport system permease protein